MLAHRLKEIADDLIGENNRLGLMSLLMDAQVLSSSRGTITENQYRAKARELRDRATIIVENNIFKNYSSNILDTISNSEISFILPDRIGRLILKAIPSQTMANAMSSAEFSSYIDAANSALSNAAGLISFTRDMSLETYDNEQEDVLFDIIIPRIIFENNLGDLGGCIIDFETFLLPLSEYFDGERSYPQIIYISTSDPLFRLKWAKRAIVGFLILYNPILEAAEKTVDLLGSIDTLRGGGLSDKQFADLKNTIEGNIDEIIREHIRRSLEEKLAEQPPERTRELVNEITINSVNVVKSVAKGARVIFNSHLLSEENNDLKKIDFSIIQNAITQQKELENRLNRIRKSVEEQNRIIKRLSKGPHKKAD